MIGPRAIMRAAKLEKRNPLPPGRYWIDIFKDGLPTWIAWNAGHIDTVSILKTEAFLSNKLNPLTWIPLPGWAIPDSTVPIEATPDRVWVLFEVRADTEWGIATTVGWPTIAGSNVRTSDDTVQKPKPKEFSFENLTPTAKFALTGVGVVVLGFVAIKLFR